MFHLISALAAAADEAAPVVDAVPSTEVAEEPSSVVEEAVASSTALLPAIDFGQRDVLNVATVPEETKVEAAFAGPEAP